MGDVHVPTADRKKVVREQCSSISEKINKIRLKKANGNHDASGEFSSIAEQSDKAKADMAQRLATENKSVDRNKYINPYRGESF